MKFDENSSPFDKKLNIETLIFNRTNTETILECMQSLINANFILNLGLFIIGIQVNPTITIELINFLSNCQFTRLKCLTTNLFQDHILTKYFEPNSLALQSLISKVEKLYLCYYDVGCYSFFGTDFKCCSGNFVANKNPLFGICGINKDILADNIYPAGGSYWRPLRTFDFTFEQSCFEQLFSEPIEFKVDALVLGWTDQCNSCDFSEVVDCVLGYFLANAKFLNYIELRFECATCNGSNINNHRNDCEFKNLETRLGDFGKSKTKYRVTGNKLKIFF
jgi:hypothetical protein